MFSDSDDDSTDNSEFSKFNNDNENDSKDNLHLHLHDDSDATCSNTAGLSTDNLTARITSPEVSTHTGHKGMNKDYEHLSTYGSLPLAMKAEVLGNLDDNRWVRGNKYTIVDELSWETFDEYKQHIRTINYVNYEKKPWITSKCSCEYWAKNYFCHHVVGLAVINNKAHYQDVHKQIMIIKKRKPGQPKKTTSALRKQDDYISSDTS